MGDSKVDKMAVVEVAGLVAWWVYSSAGLSVIATDYARAA